METTAQKLNDILSAIEDAPLQDELFQSFHLLNPIDYAKLLHSLSLPDATKAQLLALKVGMPTPYKGTDLEPLISRAMEQMWARLSEGRV
jgi:hypothetical protein